MTNRSPWIFFLLVFLLAVPFYVLGALFGVLPLPVKLPYSALMFVAPLIAAAILVYREGGREGLARFLGRAFDYRRIPNKSWLAPILLISPLITVLTYALMRLLGRPLPANIEIPFYLAPVFIVVFMLSTIMENLGWMGYAFDPLESRYGALNAALITGLVWGTWHVIPYMQQGEEPGWILFQVLNSVALRVIIAWAYNNTGKSVFAAALVHMMYDVGVYLFPNYGSHYDPYTTFAVTALAAAAIVIAWGPRTLSRERSPRAHPTPS